MKKALLACSIIVSSCFFASAQINLNLCTTQGNVRACYNSATGQYQVVDAQGRGVSGNANTGAIGGSGTIGGVGVTGGIGGSGGGIGGNQNFSGPLGLLALAQTIVVRLAPFLIGLALLAFFWFLVEFIWKGKDNPDEQSKGKKGMAYSILAIFVMVSIWGIIGFVGGVLGINQGGTMTGFKLPGEN